MIAPQIDPIIFSLGPLQVRWYGFMSVVGFIIAGFLLRYLARKGFFKIIPDKVDSLITHALISMFLGARFFYVFIYNWDYYSQNLGDLLAVWKGGLSFHGAIVGILLGCYLFAKKNNVTLLQVLDSACLAGCQGIFWGRMGNFINGELYGRVTDSPFGMIFPGAGPYPRHPSQLYEGVLEGLILFVILWIMYRKVRTHGYFVATFILGYGCFRYIVEFFREADSQLGYYFGGTTTMGQILCLVMIGFGLWTFYYSKKQAQQITFEPIPILEVSPAS